MVSFYYFKWILLCCFSVPLASYIPFYFAFKIMPKGDENLYTIGLTELGENMFFKLYLAFLFLLEDIFLIISLTSLNFIALFKFRKMMKEKRRVLVTEKRHIHKAQIRFTKLILALTFICILTRFSDTVVAILNVAAAEAAYDIKEVLRTLSFFLLIASHALDGILYFTYDMQLGKVLRRKAGIRDSSQRGQDIRNNILCQIFSSNVYKEPLSITKISNFYPSKNYCNY